MAHRLRRQGVRVVQGLPDLQQSPHEDRLQSDRADGQQQRSPPPGQYNTVVYKNVE